MFRHVILVLSLLLIISQKLASQTDSTNTKVLRGIIVDDSLGYILPLVHLWNEGTQRGTISNESGEFSIHAGNHDTLIFSALGYSDHILVVSNSVMIQNLVVRLKPKKYEIEEVIVRRFGNYESFKYQVIHLDLPNTRTDYLREYIRASAATAAMEADRERAIEDHMNGFGYAIPLSGGISREKEIIEKISNLKKREQIINEKFNRELVRDITQLEEDKLTEFIALCNFSDDYLYKTDLYTIIEALYAKYEVYQNMSDSIPSVD